MAEQQTPAQRLLGDFAPKIVQLTGDVLFGDVWNGQGGRGRPLDPVRSGGRRRGRALHTLRRAHGLARPCAALRVSSHDNRRRPGGRLAGEKARLPMNAARDAAVPDGT